MTVRRKQKMPTSPEAVAAKVPAVALEMFPPEDYRSYFGALTEEVEEVTRQHDHGLTLRVAETLGVDPASWFRSRLRRESSLSWM